jgi:hypothetical protein
MNRKKVLLITVAVVMIMSSLLVNAKSIEDIVGKDPDIKKVNEKLEELKQYTVEKFSDVKSDSWFVSSVSKLTALKGISGYPDGTFKPQNPTTTAEFLAMLLASMGYKQEAGEKEWYDNYVEKAKELMVIDPWDNYNYKEGIKRKDMAKMICKMVKVSPVTRQTVFTDVEGMDTRWIDAGFEEYLIRGYYSNGVRTYKPNQTATRAEVSEMVVRAIEYYDDPEGFKLKMKQIYEESEKKQGTPEETTVNLNGFIVPKKEYTDLLLEWDDAESETNKEYRVALNVAVNIYRPLEKQYEQLESILLQKFSKSTVDTIMNLVKKKKERMDVFASERLILENRLIYIDYPQPSVNILIYEEGAHID